MVSSVGARLLVVVPLVIAWSLLVIPLLSSPAVFVGSASPRFCSHQLQHQLAPSRHHQFQGSKVTANFFKKLLNRKQKGKLAETAPDIEEPAVFKKIEAALEKGEIEAVGSISSVRAEVAEPMQIAEQQRKPVAQVAEPMQVAQQHVEPALNSMIDEAAASPQVKSKEDNGLQPAVGATMIDDDFSFKVSEVSAKNEIKYLLKKEDDMIYDFFVELTERIESLWNARTAKV